jgi:DNA-binding transcriptional ArsR family regulator
MVTVSKHRPLEGKLLIDCLSDETRRQILKILIDRWRLGVTASELAEALQLRLPTILEHLHLLEEAGLVRFQYRQRGGRMAKVYEVTDTIVTLQIDLELFTSIPPRTKLEEYAMRYFSAKRSQGLKGSFSIEDVAKTLNLDQRTATVVYDFLASRRGEFTRILGMDILELLKERQQASIQELSQALKVDQEWVTSAVNYLVEKGYVMMEGDVVKPFTISVEEK